MKLGLLAAASLLATAMLFAAGCTSDRTRSGSPTGSLAFAPEAPATDGATVSLRSSAPDVFAPNRVIVDVVARGAADLLGAAFRVTWDPAELGFVEAKSGPSWSKHVLALAKEGAPGQLAVAWTEKGETGIDARAQTVIGTLTFELRGHTGTSLSFKTERSQLVDKKGTPITATWAGSAIAAR
jgi:hypothetical protein